MRCTMLECMVKNLMHGQLGCNGACLACSSLHSEALHKCTITAVQSQVLASAQSALTQVKEAADFHNSCLHSYGLRSSGNV